MKLHELVRELRCYPEHYTAAHKAAIEIERLMAQVSYFEGRRDAWKLRALELAMKLDEKLSAIETQEPK